MTELVSVSVAEYFILLKEINHKNFGDEILTTKTVKLFK